MADSSNPHDTDSDTDPTANTGEPPRDPRDDAVQDQQRIDELSARLNDKLVELEQQKLALHQAHEQMDDPAAKEVIEKDMAKLGLIEQKLRQSRDLTWEAYQLRQQSLTDAKRLNRWRWLGLGLFTFGTLGAVVLLGLIAWEMLQ